MLCNVAIFDCTHVHNIVQNMNIQHFVVIVDCTHTRSATLLKYLLTLQKKNTTVDIFLMADQLRPPGRKYS